MSARGVGGGTTAVGQGRGTWQPRRAGARPGDAPKLGHRAFGAELVLRGGRLHHPPGVAAATLPLAHLRARVPAPRARSDHARLAADAVTRAEQEQREKTQEVRTPSRRLKRELRTPRTCTEQ